MIRKAAAEDLEEIQKLHGQYILDISKVNDPEYGAKVQNEGFTVSSGESDLLKRIQESLIFNVSIVDGRLAGYIDINKEIYFPEDAENIIWLNTDLKNVYFHQEDSIKLHHIATSPDFRGKGIASELLNKSLEELKEKGYKHLFAIVTTSPLTNNASIAFHEKMGFKKVCITKPIDLFSLKNYESLLFYKQIL